MTRRRLLLGLFLLAITVAGSLTLWRSKNPVLPSLQRALGHDMPAISLSFLYHSSSYLNPVVPGSKKAGAGITVACDAKGTMHAVAPVAADLSFVFEFQSIVCADTDLVQARGLLRTVQYSREFLISPAAVQRAAEDPALAIARTLFFHFDTGARASWPQPATTLVNRELRIEGEIVPKLQYQRVGEQIRWTKSFAGTLTHQGLAHQIHYEVSGQSEPQHPIDLGLNKLKGNERAISLQNKHLIARTDTEIELRRVGTISGLRWRALLADLKIDAPAAAPKILSTEEKQELVQRWRKFRDNEGQKAVEGESESNQPAYLELKQALRRDANLAEELAPDLRDMDPASSGFATLAGALVYSGETRALDAFVQEAAQHRDNDAWQMRSVPLIGLAPVPTEQSFKYLENMRKEAKDPELKTAAELGMATQLKRGYQDPKFVDEIDQRLQVAQSEDERLHLLDLIGNAGLDQFFASIDSWIPGSSLTLKIRIAQSLRFMNVPAAEDRLLQMAGEPQLELALTALQYLRDRTVRATALPVLLLQLEKAQDDRVRMKILENLYESRRLDPGLLSKVHGVREKTKLTPNMAEAWDQIEKDWLDPVES